MKHLIITVMLLFTVNLFGQVTKFEDMPQEILDCLLEMGKDTIPTLNTCESKYMNSYFQKNRGTFDFREKKIAFFTGNAGAIKSTKKDFFDEEKYFIYQNRFLPWGSSQLIVFNEDESKQVGYNAVIISSSKKYITKKDVIKQLKKK